MIKIQFSDDEIQALKRERYTYPHPRIQEKMEVLYLKSMGITHCEICRLCNISRPTLAKYLHLYQSNGIDGLKHWDYAGRTSKLAIHSGSLEAYFKKHPPATSTQAVEEIEKLTGIRRSPTQVREFMNRIGMRFRKTGFVPKGTENELKQQEQDEFIKKNSNANCRKPRKTNEWCFS
jgi:transposase